MNYKDAEILRSDILPDVMIIKPSVSWDERGNIYTSYNKYLYDNLLPLDLHFVHDKFAQSRKNVLWGLHGDTKTWKMISCVWGHLYAVVADMRPDSPTYKKWAHFELDHSYYTQILVPPMFVNGYYVESEYAIFHYKLAYEGEYFDVDNQFVVKWNDPELNITWPCDKPILQNRDR